MDRGLAREQFAIGPHFVGLGIYFDFRCVSIEHHVRFPHRAGARNPYQSLVEEQRAGNTPENAAWETNVTLVAVSARPYAPNMGR